MGWGDRCGCNAKPILPMYLRVLETLYSIKGFKRPPIGSLQRLIEQAHRRWVSADNPLDEVYRCA